MLPSSPSHPPQPLPVPPCLPALLRSLAVAHDWIEEICTQPGCVKAVDAEMLTQADHPILEDDHM